MQSSRLQSTYRPDPDRVCVSVCHTQDKKEKKDKKDKKRSASEAEAAQEPVAQEVPTEATNGAEKKKKKKVGGGYTHHAAAPNNPVCSLSFVNKAA